MKKNIFILFAAIGLFFVSTAYPEINETDFILRGKDIKSAMEESVEKSNPEIFDNSNKNPIVVVALAGEDISTPAPSIRDEVRTQKFRIIENISEITEKECIFIYTVFPSHGERQIQKDEKIIGILKKRNDGKYLLLTAVIFSEENLKEIKKEKITPDKFKQYIPIADKEAKKVLEEFNKSDLCKTFEGPFNLDDYKKEIKKGSFENRQIIMVSYELTKPVSFEGHPQHFSIWVYKDTLETKVFGGE